MFCIGSNGHVPDEYQPDENKKIWFHSDLTIPVWIPPAKLQNSGFSSFREIYRKPLHIISKPTIDLTRLDKHKFLHRHSRVNDVPFSFQSIFIAMWVNFKVLTYNRTYKYPIWAQGLGMCLAFSSMIWIPIVFIYKLATAEGTIKEVKVYSCSARLLSGLFHLGTFARISTLPQKD